MSKNNSYKIASKDINKRYTKRIKKIMKEYNEFNSDSNSDYSVKQEIYAGPNPLRNVIARGSKYMESFIPI